MRSWDSIRSGRDFQRILRSGGRAGGDGGLRLVVVRAGIPSSRPKLGFAVKAPDAVTRNRVKRRLRAAADRADLPVGVELVVASDPRILGLPFQELVVRLEAVPR